VIGICTDPSCNIPCLIPRQIIFIHQHTHQLRHRHAGVGIIQLKCHLIWQFVEIGMLFLEARNHTLHRCGNEEILLPQTQLLPLYMLIRRIQHIRQRIGKQLLLRRLLIIALIEGFQIQSGFGLCLP